MVFQVGDIITGKKSADKFYSYTTSKATMKVVDVRQHEIDVYIMEHRTYKSCIGKSFPVYTKHFTLVKSAAKSNYIEEE